MQSLTQDLNEYTYRQTVYYTISHFYNNVSLFVTLTTLGTAIEFWLVGPLSWVFKRFKH